MQTIKTAVVVVLLLGVCYGAYVALNAPEPTLPPELAEWNEAENGLSVDTGTSVDIPQLTSSAPLADLPPLAPPAIVPPANNSSSATPPMASIPAAPSIPEFPPSLDLDPKKGDSLTDKLIPETKTPELPDGTSVPLPSFDAPPSLDGSNFAADKELGLPPMPPLSGSGAPGAGASLGFPEPPTDLPAPGVGLSLPTNPVGSIDPKASKTALPYAVAQKQALQLADEGKLKAALELMSPYFDHISLTEAEHKDLRELLDALAGEVIYSKRHLIENRFVVSSGDKLEAIANKFRVSPETLASINRLDSTRIVLPGTELKVFHGPFRAEVDLSRAELVMYLGDLYAGVFPVSIGNSPKPQTGSFTIVQKLRDKSYVTPKSEIFNPSDPRNPYGGYWIHLGNEICIHGSAEDSDPSLKDAGCISLAPLDAREIYNLLGQGGEVVIKE